MPTNDFDDLCTVTTNLFLTEARNSFERGFRDGLSDRDRFKGLVVKNHVRRNLLLMGFASAKAAEGFEELGIVT